MKFNLILIFCSSFNSSRAQFDNFGNQLKPEPNNSTGTNGDYGVNPLTHLNESVNNLDPLNAMEKSLNDQVSIVDPRPNILIDQSQKKNSNFARFQMPHTPHTPHTPGGSHPMTPGGPPSVPPATQNENTTSNNSPPHHTSGGNNTGSGGNNGMNASNPAANIMNSPQSLMNSPQNMMNSPMNNSGNNNNSNSTNGGNISNNPNLQQNLMNTLAGLTDVDLNAADLNFDPAAVIDGEGGNDLNVSFIRCLLIHKTPKRHYTRPSLVQNLENRPRNSSFQVTRSCSNPSFGELFLVRSDSLNFLGDQFVLLILQDGI